MKIRVPTILEQKLSYLILAFSTAIHLITILREYAWADDWAFVSGYRTASPEIRYIFTSGLRPILQLIMNESFGRISEYQNLVFLRLISLIGLLILTYQIMKHLSRLEYSRYIVLGFGVLINFLPTFWIYTNWASVFIYSWVCLLSLISFKIFERNKTLSIILSTTCFLIYQPTAVFSAFLVFTYLLKNGKLDLRNWLYLWSLSGSSGLGFLFGKIVVMFSGLSTNYRTEIINTPMELVEKAIWILTRPVLLSVRPFIIESRGYLAVIITLAGVLLSLLCIWRASELNGFAFLKFGIGLLAVLMVGLLPIIPIKENQIEFRTLPATSCIGLLLILYGFEQFKLKAIKKKAISFLLSVITIFSLTLYSQQRINQVFIDSFQQNYRYIQSSYLDQGSPDEVSILVDSKPWPQRNYIGALSVKSDLQMPWVPVGEISQILGIEEDQLSIQTFDEDEEVSVSNKIDLRKLRERLANEN